MKVIRLPPRRPPPQNLGQLIAAKLRTWGFLLHAGAGPRTVLREMQQVIAYVRNNDL